MKIGVLPDQDVASPLPEGFRIHAKEILRSVGILLLVALAIGCGAKPEDAVLGKWVTVSLSQQDNPLGFLTGIEMEFLKGGTVAVVVTLGTGAGTPTRVSATGSYRFVEDNRMRVEIPGGNPPITLYSVAIAGDDLTLTDPAGNAQRLRRSR